MSNMLHGSTFFCMAISLFGYEAGIFLRKKLKIGIFNPLLVSIVFVPKCFTAVLLFHSYDPCLQNSIYIQF